MTTETTEACHSCGEAIEGDPCFTGSHESPGEHPYCEDCFTSGPDPDLQYDQLREDGLL